MNAKDQFEEPKHTPGPWRLGTSGGVVCDTPIKDGIPGSDEVKYYGGHLICESMTFANARLIAAAPDLLEALQAITDNDGQAGSKCFDAIEYSKARDRAFAAIAKATGA